MKNPSLPCACCYRIVDLEEIEPTGICLGSLVQFECPCGNTRMIHKNNATPQVLEKAVNAMRKEAEVMQVDRKKANTRAVEGGAVMAREYRFEIPEGTRLVNCRSCKSPIYFIPRPGQPEKKMPVNPDGVSHFATCPEAASFRKGKTP